jgi:6-carboxyhexanoate--CoA ligase
MKDLLSIRMRASKKLRTRNYGVSSKKEVHISGAEGIYGRAETQKVVRHYIERALRHPRGKADKIVITIEDIKQKPYSIKALPIATIRCSSPAEGKKSASVLLQSLGISKRSIDNAFQLIRKGGMRGASLITATNGERLEPDIKRGIRVSRLGIDKSVSDILSRRLKKCRININTVKEALVIASKAISCQHVIAELCVSDDPDYTTGYVASKQYGYLRIPHIKPKGNRSGGRAFFVDDRGQVEKIFTYLEKMPILVTKSAPCRGIISIDEILSGSYK